MFVQLILQATLAALVVTGAASAAHAAVQDDAVKAEFETKKAALGADDAQGHFELALWCDANGLKTDYRRLLRTVIKLDPEHAQARELLGYQKYNGEWMLEREIERLKKKEEEQKMEAMGFRKWDGEWYPAEEVAMMEKGLFKAEIDGKTEWVDQRTKTMLDQGLSLYKGQWITKEEQAKVDAGLFKVGEEWLTKEQANEKHTSFENPWVVDSDYALLTTTCDYDFATQALLHADVATKKAYEILGIPIPEKFPKLNLILVTDVENYKQIGTLVQEDIDANMSSNFARFTAVNPESNTIIGVVHYTELPNAAKPDNDRYTLYLVRNAAAEAALRTAALTEPLPRWLVTGVATYLERIFDPFSGDWKVLGNWTATTLQSEGGMKDLEALFTTFGADRASVLSSGLLVTYILQGQDVPDTVKKQWAKVREMLAAKDQTGLSKETIALEAALAKDCHRNVIQFSEMLIGG